MSQRGAPQELSVDISSDDSVTVPSHPVGVKPTGNAYNATKNLKSATGFFIALPDELLVKVLEYLDASSLREIGCTSKAMYAFSRLEDLWKTLCIEYGYLSYILLLMCSASLGWTVCTYIRCPVVFVLRKYRI